MRLHDCTGAASRLQGCCSCGHSPTGPQMFFSVLSQYLQQIPLPIDVCVIVLFAHTGQQARSHPVLRWLWPGACPPP